MTPIINELVKLAVRRGAVWDKSGSDINTPQDLVRRVADAKPFFLPNASADLLRLCKEHPTYVSESAGVFPPAPKSWIECGPMGAIDSDSTTRTAFLIDGEAANPTGLVIMTMPNGRLVVVDKFTLHMALDGGDSSVEFSGWLPPEDTAAVGARLELALLLINMPIGLKIADRPAHKANAKAHHRLCGVRPAVSYRTVELDPWCKAESGEPGAPTGSRRAFHFCRAHIRTRQTGREELVRAHWRGDQALGRVESRYEIAAPVVR